MEDIKEETKEKTVLFDSACSIMATWNENKDWSTEYKEKFNSEYILSKVGANASVKGFLIKHDKGSNVHYHIFIYNAKGTKSTTLINALQGVHLDKVKGSRKQVYDYFLHQDLKSVESGKDRYLCKDIILINLTNDELDSFLHEDEKRRSNSDLDAEILELLLQGKNLTFIFKKFPFLIWKVNTLKTLAEVLKMDGYVQDKRDIMNRIFDEEVCGVEPVRKE